VGDATGTAAPPGNGNRRTTDIPPAAKPGEVVSIVRRDRATRIRKVIPGAPDELVAALAARPAAEVDLTIAGLRQARRDALNQEKASRRQRRADARKYRHYDEDQLAARNIRMISATGTRASGDLTALESLADFTRHADSLMHLAVAGLRSRGYPDEEIGRALGITRQAVGQRFGRKRGFTSEEHQDGAA
jgi:hypothetical protein